MNTFGQIFRLTTFGESHGEAIGGVIDGLPAGIVVDYDFVQNELDRRRPGQSAITTQRRETDKVRFLSGIFEGKSTGTPIAFVIENNDHRSSDYDELREVYRPSHADFTYEKKYGIRDYRGGGRASARVTISRVVAGALAKIALSQVGISIKAYTSQIGTVALNHDYSHYDLKKTEQNSVRCPDEIVAEQMETLLRQLQGEGDTTGGIVSCVIRGCPAGLGEPEFDKLNAALGSAMLSINAAKGFEIGEGWRAASSRGSEMNDSFVKQDAQTDRIGTVTNHSGGIQGGISNGEDIYFNVAFKPIPTLLKEQETCDIHGHQTTIKARGRHDVCVVPRAVPIVESMAAMTILDFYLLSKTTRMI